MKSLFILLGLLCLGLLSSPATAQSTVYFANLEEGAIKRISLDGSGQPETIAQQSFSNYHAFEVNPQMLIYVDRGKKEIIQVRTDGTQGIRLASGLEAPKGITLLGAIPYFIDGNGIYQLLTAEPDLILGGLNAPADLRIGPDNRIYFSDTGSRTIESCQLDGSDRRVVLSDVLNATHIDIDQDNSLIYYIQNLGGGSQRGVWRVGLDGENREQLVSGSVNGVGIRPGGDLLYWSESVFNTINERNLETGAERRIFPGTLNNPTSITIDFFNDRLFFTDNLYGDILLSATVSTGVITPLATTEIYRPSELTVDEANGKVYWINAKTSFVNDRRTDIVRANLDGEKKEILFSNPDIARPDVLALDTVNAKLFWTDLSRGTISRSDLDGGNRETIVSGLDNPSGLTIDQTRERIYWTDWGTDKIQSADLDGGNVTDIITEGLATPVQVAIHDRTRRLYWADISSGDIRSANLDGSDITPFAPLADDDGSISARTLFVDQLNDLIYFFGRYDGVTQLQRADPDGSNRMGLLGDAIPANSSIFVAMARLTSVSELLEGPAVSVAPNPVTDLVTVSSEEMMKSIQLYDGAGRLSFSNDDAPTRTLRFSMATFPSGLYFGVVTYADGRRARVRIVR